MIGRKLTAVLRGSSQFVRISAPSSHAGSYFRLIANNARRTYATPGRPRSTVGEPSRPIKRTTKRSSTSKTDAKAAPKPKKKKAAAKKPAKKAAKKVLTPEQVTARKARAEAARVRELKQTALKPPSRLSSFNAYNVYVREQMATMKSADGKVDVRAAFKTIAAGFKSVTPSELERYNHEARAIQRDGAANYQAWVASHSPEQIEAANSARRRLRSVDKRTLKPKHKTSWAKIEDSRLASKDRQVPAYALFTKSRFASGDFKHISVTDAAKLIGTEWKALSADEKQKYKQAKQSSPPQSKVTLAADVGYMNTSHQQAATAAA